MTSKKKLRKKIARLEQANDQLQASLADLRRKWLRGEQPTAIDRMVENIKRADTPLLNLISDMPRTNLTWGWSSPSSSAEVTGPVPAPEGGIVVDENDGSGWLLTPRSEEKV